MKLVTEYLQQAADFERMADQATDAALKQRLLEQPEHYWKLANDRGNPVR